MVTQKRLKEILDYNSDTGDFIWIKKISNRTKIGTIAGGLNNLGYRIIGVDKRRYNASRLAWLYMKGYFPENDIDHKNRIRHHNWINNLKEANKQCNMRNANKFKNNTSGVTGIHWFKRDKTWQAQIAILGKRYHLGYFKNFIDAVKARWKAEKEHDYPNCNSNSSSYLYLKERGLLCG